MALEFWFESIRLFIPHVQVRLHMSTLVGTIQSQKRPALSMKNPLGCQFFFGILDGTLEPFECDIPPKP